MCQVLYQEMKSQRWVRIIDLKMLTAQSRYSCLPYPQRICSRTTCQQQNLLNSSPLYKMAWYIEDSWPSHLRVLHPCIQPTGLPLWFSGKELTCQCRRHGFDPWVRKIPFRRKWQPAPVFLPGKAHGQRTMGSQRIGHNWATKQQ